MTAGRALLVGAGLALGLTACGSPAPTHHHSAALAAHSTPPIAASTPPSWCNAGLLRAVDGTDASKLLPYQHDDSAISDLLSSWTLTLAENKLLTGHSYQPWSINRLLNSAPVTTGGLYQAASTDIPQITHVCAPLLSFNVNLP